MPDSTSTLAHKRLLNFSDKLLDWFDQNGRKDLPWQQDKSPYRVWVSEIMLQQTQVASVIDYYQNFMAAFPNLEALAIARQDQVLTHWAGLGYYARARNLHKAAGKVHHEMNGNFPDTLDGLVALPGIGRSTAGAILSIAFRKRATILDGNVKRVLCRLHAIDAWSGTTATTKQLWTIAESLTPEVRVDDYTQAIMDLGATLCTRSKPDCNACPMNHDCEAFKQSRQHELPTPKPKKVIPTRETWIAHITDQDSHLLLEQRPSPGIWGGLFSLPEFDADLNPEQLIDKIEAKFGVRATILGEPKPFRHVFSHYKLIMKPILLKLDSDSYKPKASCSAINTAGISETNPAGWYSQKEVGALGLPAPIKTFLSQTIKRDLNPQSDLWND